MILMNKKPLVLTINNKKVIIYQRKDMFCGSLDAILLANFVKLGKSMHKVIDFGTNNGIIAILLALKNETIKVLGIEIQQEAIILASENIISNNLQAKVTVIHDDIKKYAANYQNDKSKKVDAIVCNPPFFPLEASTKVKKAQLKVAASHEIYIDLETIISSAAKLLQVKGKLFMIYNVTRLDELCWLLKKYDFRIKKLQIVYPKITKNAHVFLLEASYNPNSGLIMMPPLICHHENVTYDEMIAKWYNNGD